MCFRNVSVCGFLAFRPVKTDILKADLLFIKFGERFKCLYGKKAVTPNMHLHCHLKECVLDYGPLHAFSSLVLSVLMASLGQYKSVEDRLKHNSCANVLLDSLLGT